MTNPKIVFMGTPDFAVPVLKNLIENYEVVLVVTQPDKLVGRKQILTPSPIKRLALENNIPVFQPTKIRKDYEPINKVNPDLIITCAYGQIIPKEVLEIPSIGCFNVHASLLPKYRGGAPIHKAIINGEIETGVTIMYMDIGMDTGDMISKVVVPITKEDNVGSMHDKLSVAGAKLLLETLPSIINKTNPREPQKEEEASFAYNIKREDEHLDLERNGEDLINQIRGLNPWPTANILVNNEEFKILNAYFEPKKVNKIGEIIDIKKDAIGVTCQNGILYITELKPFGKKIMSTKDYLNGVEKENLKKMEVR